MRVEIKVYPSCVASGADALFINWITGARVGDGDILITQSLARVLIDNNVTLVWITGGAVNINELPERAERNEE